MKQVKVIMPLRNAPNCLAALGWVFNKQANNEIDSRAADALNTTLKGAIYLCAKLKLDAAKLTIQAQIKKLELPPGLLEDLGLSPGAEQKE